VNFNGALFLVAGWSRYIGRFYADVADENFDDRVDLLCVKVLSLKPYSSNGDGDEDEQKQDGQVDTQGLVVAPLSTSRGFDGELNYQRVGYFTTKPFHGIDFSQDLFTGSQYKKISLR
jgi:hypothetical protein